MGMPELTKKVLKILLATPLVMGLFFFVPAGTLDYPQAWALIGTILFPAIFVMLYFLKYDPEFLERRLKTKEKEAGQKLIVKAGAIILLIAFLLPGLDRRFGWSQIPIEVSLAADLIVFLSYIMVFQVFRENSYAGRTVEVEKGQKVISTGLYSIVRHPMYLGTLIMYLAVPIALGSYVALPIFALYIPVLVFRILNEEEVLRKELPGYKEYCQKTRYRLIPFIW